MAECDCISIEEEQEAFIRDFNSLEDWMIQYECLLGLTADMPVVYSEEKIQENLIEGCQARLWVVLSFEDGRVRVRIDSEALIVKGIAAVIAKLFDKRYPEEICNTRLDFLERTSIRSQISTDRFHGMLKLIERICNYAGAQRA